MQLKISADSNFSAQVAIGGLTDRACVDAVQHKYAHLLHKYANHLDNGGLFRRAVDVINNVREIKDIWSRRRQRRSPWSDQIQEI